MVSSRWKSLAALVLASAGLGGFAAFAEEQAAETEQPIEVRARWVAQDGEVVPLEGFTADVAEEASPYWIGVQLESPTDILKQHLNLDGGMVTVHVFEGSPAAKAGLQVNDIILKAADTYVKEPGDLLKCVGVAKETELTLVLLRGGKEQTLQIVPAKRPQEDNPQAFKVTVTEEKEAVQKLEAALRIYWDRNGRTAAVAGEAPLVAVLRPGVVVGWEGKVHLVGLPKDVSVTISKEGASPAKILVIKDGKEFPATEDNLNQLPEELRGYVQQVRGGGEIVLDYSALKGAPKAELTLRANRTPTIFKADVTVPTPVPPAATESSKVYRYDLKAKPADGDADSKLDRILKIVSQKEDSSVSALRKEVQQLRKELHELRQEKK